MLDKFDRWITSDNRGVPFKTLYECINEDKGILIDVFISNFSIMLGYAGIAYIFLKCAKAVEDKAQKTMFIHMVLIFIMCHLWLWL